LSLNILYAAYFTSPLTIIGLLVPLSSLIALYVVFKRTDSPVVRSKSLGFMLLSSVFLWLFVAVSLVLCYEFAEIYEYQLDAGIRTVFGGALIVAVASGIPISVLLIRIAPTIMLSKVKGLSSPDAELSGSFDGLAVKLGVPSAELRLSRNKAPVSFAVQTATPIVVISESLLSILSRDELQTVMAHELAHIKNSDTNLKAIVTAYKTALPMDPVIRLVEAAFHREREMVADEVAAKATGKPLSLASALLKIYEAFPKNNLSAYGTLSILGSGSTVLSRHPPIRYRINQLIQLSEKMR